MIIRSQDKKAIVNFNNLTEVCIGGAKENKIEALDNRGVLELGKYSTEEKAIKVLDMICERYQCIWDAENGFLYGGTHFGSVFKMPQDSEV